MFLLSFLLFLALTAQVAISRVNLAENKPTQQDSVYYDGESDLAVDGNFDQEWGGGSCTHTFQSGQHFWSVDLGNLYRIEEVVVWNRRDCCSERLTGLKVYLSNDAPVTWSSDLSKQSQCQEFPGSSDGVWKLELSCHNQLGRFVSLLKSTPVLTLCEVQVFEEVGKLMRGRGGRYELLLSQLESIRRRWREVVNKLEVLSER